MAAFSTPVSENTILASKSCWLRKRPIYSLCKLGNAVKPSVGPSRTADYKGLRVKTQNFVFLSNVIRTLIFHKLLTNNDCIMNLRLFHFISFYVER